MRSGVEAALVLAPQAAHTLQTTKVIRARRSIGRSFPRIGPRQETLAAWTRIHNARATRRFNVSRAARNDLNGSARGSSVTAGRVNLMPKLAESPKTHRIAVGNARSRPATARSVFLVGLLPLIAASLTSSEVHGANEKIGVSTVSDYQAVPYTIRFENVASASG